MFKDFGPALKFLGTFLGIYILGNVLYGFYVNAFLPKADPASFAVTAQTSACLNLAGESTTYRQHPLRSSVALLKNGETVISVFEGCNGLNVMIIFIAFIFAFGGPLKTMAWFVPVGLLVIHVVNLLRVALLYSVSLYYEQYFYYVHKYFFTAILYLVVFILWAVWVKWFSRKTA